MNKICPKCNVEKLESDYYPYSSKCKACHIAYARKRDLEKKGDRAARDRRYFWKRRYGILESEYNDLLSSQNNVCAVCAGVNESGHYLSVDHCHTSGDVRGLLCTRCNTALGKVKDDVEILRNLINYLEKHAQKKSP
jgi:hypothetical protein